MRQVERKRTWWSLLIGATVALAVVGVMRGLEWRAARQLQALITDCEKPDPRGPALCQPGDLRQLKMEATDGSYTIPITDEQLIQGGGVTAKIIQADQTVTWYRDNRWHFAAFILAAACIPLVWYFLLDRLRELASAIFGRDAERP